MPFRVFFLLRSEYRHLGILSATHYRDENERRCEYLNYHRPAEGLEPGIDMAEKTGYVDLQKCSGLAFGRVVY